MNEWISDFSGNRNHTKVKLQENNEELFMNKYAPSSQLDLAVHKKKISEVEDWFKNILTRRQKKPSVLLLTGPTGAGKTITLQILAKELKVDVQEWINPVANDTPFQKNNLNDDASKEIFYSSRETFSESQASKFSDFLLRTNRYPTLDIFGGDAFDRKLILVEDFPNVFLKETTKFHEILRNFCKRGSCPIVFILSDGDHTLFNERLLFPPDIQQELRIDCIRFNPVAPTNMVKVLTRIASMAASQNRKGIVPSKETLEEIIQSSDGDVRSAVNVLQFYCLNNSKKSNFETNKKTKNPSLQKPGSKRSTIRRNKSATKNLEESSIGLKDTNLSLFRALGKILHCKRSETKEEFNYFELPSHLQQFCRDPLLINPEEVFEKSQMSAESYSAFLHQNYLEFYKNLEDVVMASEYLSDAESFVKEWSTKSALENYYASVVTRGMLFSNVPQTVAAMSSSTGPGWRPLHKPQSFSVIKRSRDNAEAVRNLFQMSRMSTTELSTQAFPYLRYLDCSHLNQRQRSLVLDIGRFTSDRFSGRIALEKLDEKESVLTEEIENESTDGKFGDRFIKDESNTETIAPVDCYDDDLVIEEFDD